MSTPAAALARRAETALGSLLLHEDTLANQWRECCARWGVESPAAMGCLLELVRDASGNEWANLEVYGGKWHARFASGATPFNSELEALVAALEAAPS